MSWNDCPICGEKLIYDKDCSWVACLNRPLKYSFPHYYVSLISFNDIEYEIIYISPYEITRLFNETGVAIEELNSNYPQHKFVLDSVLPLNKFDKNSLDKLILLI